MANRVLVEKNLGLDSLILVEFGILIHQFLCEIGFRVIEIRFLSVWVSSFQVRVIREHFREENRGVAD